MIMKNVTNIKHWLLYSLLAICFYSCELIEANENEFAVESEKSITGTWEIINVTRNGQDITEKFDFSKFKINFLSDHHYTIENPVPFLVYENGMWSLDDPNYPFQITFEGMDDLTRVDFSYPIKGGERQLHFTFSPGCKNNTYKYSLKRITKE